MIVALEGIIEKKEPTRLEINVNGVVYEVFVSLNCTNKIDGNKIKILTTHIIKDDGQTLYGFLDTTERKLFATLIKINGVGPKVALAICSTFTPETFAKIISNKDITMLKKVPGIGPKSASRILVELSGFSIEVVEQDSDKLGQNSHMNDAVLALESLGFKKENISKVIVKCTSTSTADIVKEALKYLSR